MTEYLRVAEIVRRPCYLWQNWRSILGRNTSWSHGLYFHNDFVGSVKWRRTATNVVIGGKESGKSGIWKAQIDQTIEIREMHYGRASGIVFDGVGDDGRLLAEPGKEGFIFEKEGMYRKGHKNIVSMTPGFLSRDAEPDDILFCIPWTDLKFEEWDYIFSQMGDAVSWLFLLKGVLIRRQKLIKSLPWLLEEFEKRAWDKTYESEVIPNRIPQLAVEAIVRGLGSIIEQGFLSEPSDKRNYSVVDLMHKGWIPVINFHHNSDAATKLYVGVMARQVYEYCESMEKYHRRNKIYHWTGPFIVFEEFSSIVVKQEMGDPATPAEKRVADLIKKANKYRIELWAVLQDMKDTSPEVRRSLLSDRVFVRNPTPDDLREIEAKFTRKSQEDEGVSAGEIIKSLSPFPEESGAREWVLFDNGQPTTFMGVGAMSKLHVR